MPGRIEGKVAVVIGAGKGIGRSISQTLAREGAKVLVVSLHEETAGMTAELIKKAGWVAVPVRADISKADDMERVANKALDMFGGIHILCQNAGIFPPVLLENMTERDWDSVHSTNLRGTFLAVKACLPTMKKQQYGKIVLTSSITGPRVGFPGMSHYGASKAGMTGFIKSAAIELARYNITINSVEPGEILTEGMKALTSEEDMKRLAESIPMKRLGEPVDIAYATLFLASDESKYITGQSIIVDGGIVLPESKTALI